MAMRWIKDEGNRGKVIKREFVVMLAKTENSSAIMEIVIPAECFSGFGLKWGSQYNARRTVGIYESLYKKRS